MSGHHDATKPYQPRRGPERLPPQPTADGEEEAAAFAAAEAEAEAQAMERYESLQEHEEEEVEEEGDEGREYYGGAGEAVPMEAAAAAADAHGAMMLTAAAEAGGVPHVASNTLTLSFQGEVFVFESVSAERVQAVLLLLGGRELQPGLGSVPSSSASYSKTLNFPHRMASLMRFREKRKERNFDKKIRYSVRKDVAHRMQRHKGQFTSSKSKGEEAASTGATSDGSTSWGALEGQPPSASECHQCGISATMTPMMRRGPDGPRTLCNACGLKWANKGYKDALMEAQALRVNYISESKKREALESHIADLKKENERVRRLYTETLFKFTNQVKFHTESKNLKEELGKANIRLLSMEEEYKREIEQLKHDNEMNCNALESKLSCALVQKAADEGAIKQLELDLAAHKAHIDMLSSRLEQVTAEVHLQYNNDLQDLKDVIMVEQEEKKDMERKLKNTENELRIMKMKQAEQQRDSISAQHVETLKQKVMKLRKENESLKRKLASSELDCS